MKLRWRRRPEGTEGTEGVVSDFEWARRRARDERPAAGARLDP